VSYLTPDQIKEYERLIKEEEMEDKDYIEHEVWVRPHQKFEDFETFYKFKTQEFSQKATLRIPKPERKVEITEGELREAFFKTCSVGKELELCECDLIEEIFGRD